MARKLREEQGQFLSLLQLALDSHSAKAEIGAGYFGSCFYPKIKSLCVVKYVQMSDKTIGILELPLTEISLRERERVGKMWRTPVHTMSTASPLLLENIYLLINFVSDIGTELV